MDGGSYSGYARSMALREASAATVNSAFADFLDTQINIGKDIRGLASDSHTHLREFLATEHDRDPEFPCVLSDADNDFLGGSFARHTKIWPLDDIDIYFPLDGVGLVYTQGGVRLSYTVLSDGMLATNPLCDAPERWMTDSNISSRKLIDGFAKVLRRHYRAEVKVRRAGEAVRVRMRKGETDGGDGLGFDVVPCFSLQGEFDRTDKFYLIPDGNDGWIRTNPRVDHAVSDDLQSKNNGVFRPAVKLVKWWVANRFDALLDSYYVELAIMRGVTTHNQLSGKLTSISEATAVAFKVLKDAAWAGDLNAWIQGAPIVRRGDLEPNALWRLDSTANDAARAVAEETVGNTDKAIEIWRSIFGRSFAPAE